MLEYMLYKRHVTLRCALSIFQQLTENLIVTGALMKSKPHFLLVRGLLAKSLSLSSCSFMISLGREAIKVLGTIQKT